MAQRNRGRGGVRPTPTQNSNAIGGGSPPTLAETLLASIEGANIERKARKIHIFIFVGLIGFYASQFLAGAIDFNHGHGAMAFLELGIAIALLFFWSNPKLLGLGAIISTAAAINNPNQLTDQAVIKSLDWWLKSYLYVCAYTLSIVFTTLLLFDIKNDYDSMVLLIIAGTFIGMLTAVIGDSSTFTLQIVRAGLIGFVVMVLLTHLPGVASGNIIRDTLVSHAVLIGIFTMVIVLFGTKVISIWPWSKLSWLLSVRNLIKLIGFALFLFLAYSFFFPKEAGRIITSKVTEIQEATSESTPAVSDYSQVTTTPPKTVTKPTFKITGGTTGQKVVLGNELPNQPCTTLVRLTNNTFQFIFTPTLETLNNPPEIGTIGPGRYMVTAEGVRTQYYYGNGAENPPSDYTPQDADGIMKDRPGNLTFINGTNVTEVLFPDKPYAAFAIGLGDVNFFAGSKMFFTVKDTRIITSRLNVIPRLNPGTGSFTVKLYKCGK